MVFCKNCGNELSSDAQFCQKCGISITGTNPSTTSNASQKVKKRKGGIGKIIGGIILIIIGLIIAGIGFTFYSIQSNNVTQCNTMQGQLSQLDPETYEICTNAPAYTGMLSMFTVVGIVMIIIGIILLIFGIKHRSKPEVTTY